MLNQNSYFSKLKTAAFISLIVLTCECVFGSSGRWLEIGSLSIRMVLFSVSFLLSLPIVIKEIKELISNKIIWSIIVFGLFVCFAAVNGYMRGNNTNYIVADFTSILFLALVPAYIVIIDTKVKISILIKYASYASIVLAFIVIIIHFLLGYVDEDVKMRLNIIINDASLGGLFNFGNGISRIYFRSSICFVLPFLYFLDNVIKHHDAPGKRLVWSYVFMVVSITGIILSFTRSIWLGFFIAVVLYIAINFRHLKRIIKALTFTILGFLIFVIISWTVYGFEGIIDSTINRVLLGREYIEYQDPEYVDDDYNSQRMKEIQSEETRTQRLEAAKKIIRESWLIGSGFGETMGLEKTEGKIEYTYIDILCKAGIFGLISFLAILFLPIFYVLKKLTNKKDSTYMGVMLCVMICIYASSYFNPFITSPIGLSLYGVLVATISVKELSLDNRK